MNNFKDYLLKIRPIIEKIFYFIFSLLISISFSPLFKLPFSNEYAIENPLNNVGFNPNNNYLTIAFIIISTVGLYFLFLYLANTRFKWILKSTIILSLVLIFSFTTFLSTGPAYANSEGYADEFHSGEQLSPTHALREGDDLYSEIFFLRGAGVDVIFPSIGASLFGEAIGSFLFLGDAMRVLALIAFLVFIAILIPDILIFGVIAYLFYSSAALSLFEFRDIIVWMIFALMYFAFKQRTSPKVTYAFFIATGALIGLSPFVSIDRGIGLLAIGAGMAIILLFFSKDKNNAYKFNPRKYKDNWKNSAALLFGVVLGVIVPSVLIGWDGFINFVKMSFLEIPKYGGLLVSQPYPPFEYESILFWSPVLIAIASIILMITIYRINLIRYFNTLIPLSALLLFSVYALKIGSNRIALGKLVTATTPLMLAAALLLILSCVLIYKHKSARLVLIAPTVILASCMIVFSQLDITKLFTPTDSSVVQAKSYIHKVKQPDNFWISPEMKEVKDYVQRNTTPDDYLFSFTSNAMYYYVTDRKNPSRFYINWYTDPSPYETELLESLKERPPKIVIYSNNTWTDAPDTISMAIRTPKVNEWLLAEYPVSTTIGQTVILSR